MDCFQGTNRGRFQMITIGIILLVAFLGLAILVSSQNPAVRGVDIAVNNIGLNAQSSVLTPIMLGITSLGDGGNLTIIVIFLLLLLMIAKEWRTAACLSLGFLFVSWLTVYLKNFFMIARPNMPLASSFGNWGFPSGHTTGATIVFLILTFGLARIVKNKPLKLVSISICGLIIFLVGVSRIYLGVHWFSDVVGGWLLAGGVGMVIVGVSSVFTSFALLSKRT